MQKVSYMGNGSSTEFFFNFPYFDNDNIVVSKNNISATGYNIIGTSGGLDADIPYTGGKVVFETAPTALDCITIARQLPLSRIVDYQPLSKINPTLLNQDINYLMEILKDQKDELDGFRSQYADIADKESTETLLSRIAAIGQQITDLGDITQIRNNITTLNNRTNNLLDYVIESQSPSAINNYTWYRKYKSGWIDQGGVFQKETFTLGSGYTTVLDINLHTTLAEPPRIVSVADDMDFFNLHVTNRTTSTIQIKISNQLAVGFEQPACNIFWNVSGMAA